MPPAPGTSGELPPGYLDDEAKAARRRSERRKKRLMMAVGTVLLIGALVATVALTARSNSPQTVADLEVGECFTGGPNDVDAVDCDEPHQFELFAVISGPDPAGEFPGAADVLEQGGNECTLALVDYYGAPIEVFVADGLELDPIVPTEAQWDDDRTDSYCLARDGAGEALRSSVRGQGAG